MYDRFPIFWVPLVLIKLLIGDTWRSTDKNDTGLIAILDIDIPKNKDIGVAADETFNGQVAKLRLRMCGDFIMLWLYQVEDDMRRETWLALKTVKIRITLSLQNHLPQALCEHFMTQFLLRRPQYEHAYGGHYYDND